MFQLAHQSCQHAVDIAERIEQRRADFLFEIAKCMAKQKLRFEFCDRAARNV